MTTKTVNWTNEVVAKLTAEYDGQNIDQLATKFGKSVAAVRGKLVSLGIYQKQEPRAVGGASAVRKMALVRELATSMGVEVAEVESLEKAKKETLDLLLKFIADKAAE